MMQVGEHKGQEGDRKSHHLYQPCPRTYNDYAEVI